MKTYAVGTAVITPAGTTAIVRSTSKLRTWTRGRPYQVATVQERDRRGRLTGDVYTAFMSDLMEAASSTGKEVAA